MGILVSTRMNSLPWLDVFKPTNLHDPPRNSLSPTPTSGEQFQNLNNIMAANHLPPFMTGGALHTRLSRTNSDHLGCTPRANRPSPQPGPSMLSSGIALTPQSSLKALLKLRTENHTAQMPKLDPVDSLQSTQLERSPILMSSLDSRASTTFKAGLIPQKRKASSVYPKPLALNPEDGDIYAQLLGHDAAGERIRTVHSEARAEGTRANQARVWKQWVAFCRKRGLETQRQRAPLQPFDNYRIQETLVILRFYDYLLWEGIRGKTYKSQNGKPICGDPDTVNNYISTASSAHNSKFGAKFDFDRSRYNEQHKATKKYLTIQFGAKTPNRKEPLEPSHLAKYVTQERDKFPISPSSAVRSSNMWHDFVVKTASLLLAWQVMFRKSEFSDAGKPYNPNVHASRFHLVWKSKTRETIPPSQLHNLEQGAYCLIQTCPSKGDPAGTSWLPVIVPWRPNDILSAGYWLAEMERLDPRITRTSRTVPLFQIFDGMPTRRWLKTTDVDQMIADICTANKLWSKRFSAHSLRHGGAATLATMGIPSETIQLLGRWKSDCFKVYTRVSIGHTLDILNRMMATKFNTLSQGTADGGNSAAAH